ncbi:MAG: iron transporter [Beijerinckiaceae bacterium]|nr:iron transporter [Beijerinckiaceae bacterium]MCI0736672.1 iron transporter [Beijerinckiaceae bacterium]
MRPAKFALVHAASAIAFACSASAKEYPAGTPQEQNGMEIAAVYLQPVEMDPPGAMLPAAQSDVHLEADIRAGKDNRNGFAQGDWIPYLAVGYELTKLDGNETRKGMFMPMVANDGPHYGGNVKMMGPGKYKLHITIAPPGENEHIHFGRHADKETGVAPWFKAFAVEFEFVFAGTGKKGAY